MEANEITPAMCAAHQWSAVVWCSRCRYGRPLDLLAFEVAGTQHFPLGMVLPKLRCARVVEGKACNGVAGSVSVTRMEVGKSVPVATIERTVPVVGTIGEGGVVEMGPKS